MTSWRRELYASILGLLLGSFGVWLGTYDPLWSYLRVPSDLRGSLTIALTLYLLLSPFLVAFYLQHAAINERLSALRTELPTVMQEAAGYKAQMDVFGVVDGNQALKLLCERIKTARVVLNTRVCFGASIYEATTPALSAWERALRAAIRSGTVFREVISDGWQGLATERSTALAGAKGVYEVSCVSCSVPSLLNFVVMQHADGSKEVWFGWIMSPAHAFDQPCVRSTERRVVQLFESWHADLFSGGARVTPGVAGSRSSESARDEEGAL